MTRITTTDARNNSPRDGHDTLFISPSTEIKKSANAGICTTRKLAHSPTASTASGTEYCASRRFRSTEVLAAAATPPNRATTSATIARKRRLPGNPALAPLVQAKA